MNRAAVDRAAARDYWNSPQVARMCRRLDYLLAFSAAAALMVLGSLNF
jgi:hypothetical protein